MLDGSVVWGVSIERAISGDFWIRVKAYWTGGGGGGGAVFRLNPSLSQLESRASISNLRRQILSQGRIKPEYTYRETSNSGPERTDLHLRPHQPALIRRR